MGNWHEFTNDCADDASPPGAGGGGAIVQPNTLRWYFSKHYTGPAFRLWSDYHLGTIVLALALSGVWFLIPQLPSTALTPIRITFILLHLIAQTGWQLWNVFTRQWNWREMLPLHMCGIATWVEVGLLLTGWQPLFEWVYFFGVTGGVMALLFPDSGNYGFPHFRYLQTTFAHMILVIVPFFYIAQMGYTLTPLGTLRASLIMLAYMTLLFFLNLALKSNYMFLRHKPLTASPYDAMPPWPKYIAVVIGIGVVVVTLMSVPFWLLR